MGSPRNYRTEAVVIKQRKFGESDRVLIIYTPDFGKLEALAKGACRPGSKLGGNVEPLTHGIMSLARGRNLDIVTQSQTIDSFPGVKADLLRMAACLYVLDLVDSFTVEGNSNPSVFQLLLAVLHQLDSSATIGVALHYFEMQLCCRLGYRPELRRCVACNVPLRPVMNFFSPGRGGVLCPSCRSGADPEGQEWRTVSAGPTFPLSVAALKVLRLWQSGDYDAAERVKLRAELSSELERVLRSYVGWLLQRDVKSLAWLDQLRRAARVDNGSQSN